jgi:hypothetical protein
VRPECSSADLAAATTSQLFTTRQGCVCFAVTPSGDVPVLFKASVGEVDVLNMQHESTVPSALPAPPPPPTDWSRTPYGQTTDAFAAPPRSPDPDRCQQCGSWPARPVIFRQVTGFLLAFNVQTREMNACRSCGLAIGRAQQSKTLVTGWWGILSFICNILAVFRNGVNLVRVGRLDPPVGGVAAPLASGRSAFLRAGAIFAVLLVGAWIFIANRSDDPATWSEGNCVRYSLDNRGEEIANPVRCSESNDGRILAAVSSGDLCPVQSDGFVELDGSATLYCVDEDL